MLTRAQITLRVDLGMHIGNDPPLGVLRTDQLWLDTYDVPNVLYRWDGNGWVKTGDDIDLEDYYTKSETSTMFEQTNRAIALKADATTVTALSSRVSSAEQKITPAAIVSTVRDST